jgi:hypothetical protein
VVGKNYRWKKFEEIAVGIRKSWWAIELIIIIIIIIIIIMTMVDYSKLPTSWLCVRTSAYFHQYNGV